MNQVVAPSAPAKLTLYRDVVPPYNVSNPHRLILGSNFGLFFSLAGIFATETLCRGIMLSPCCISRTSLSIALARRCEDCEIELPFFFAFEDSTAIDRGAARAIFVKQASLMLDPLTASLAAERFLAAVEEQAKIHHREWVSQSSAPLMPEFLP